MRLQEAMQGYLMDAKIAEQSLRYIALKTQRLGYFVGWCESQGAVDLEMVTSNVVRGFIVHLQGVKAQELNPRRPTQDRTLSPLTVKGYRTIIDAFFGWCKKEGFLGGRDIPTRTIPQQKIPQYVIETFTPEQLAAMLDACETTSPIGFRDYTILLMLMDTGIRASELCGLTLDHVYEDYIKVFGKGAKEREVGIAPTASRALWKYIHQYRSAFHPLEQERHVFLGIGGVSLLRSGLYQALERVGEKAGVDGVRLSPHTFRHTFAVNYLKNGGDVFKLSRILGHTEMQTTQIYLKDFQSRQARLEHAQFSLVERFKLGKQSQKRKQK
jgi:integrase/recombinase XerD